MHLSTSLYTSKGNGMDIVNYGGGLDPASEENRIVLHEDKKYYPEASEVFPGEKRRGEERIMHAKLFTYI